MAFNPLKTISTRKDTKDSGYGGYSSECEEEHQSLPEWCHQCLQQGELSYLREENDFQETNDVHKPSDVHEAIELSENSDSEEPNDLANDSRSFCSGKVETRAGSEDFMEGNSRIANDDSKGKELVTTSCKRITKQKSTTNELKPVKRHRRMTPVPLSKPIKISLANPDCLFVEEEDTEDIRDFDLDNDFVDQGFFQLVSSPRGSPKLCHSPLDTKPKTDLHKMEGKENNSGSKNSSSIYDDELKNLQESPGVSRRQRKGLAEQRADSVSRTHIGSSSSDTLPELPRLYMRSRSENDARYYTNRNWKQSALPRVDSDSERHNREHADQNFGKSSTDINITGGMSSKDIPHIELQPAASLPDWMREARADDVSIEISTEFSPENKNVTRPCSKTSQTKQEEPSVKMRNKEDMYAWKSTKTNENTDEPEFGEDIMKIYTPKKDYEGQKPRRSRKLTPARAASPSLEKLADLQSQVYAFTLAENDSD